MKSSNLRTSELVLSYVQEHGSATVIELKQALGVCVPSVQGTVHQMREAGVLKRDKLTYTIGTVSLLRTCTKCFVAKEAWRVRDDLVCAACHSSMKHGCRANPGEKKAETLYPEWKEAVALNRIINLSRFTKLNVKSLVKELHVCH